jgi:hypothetical protein
MLTRLGHFRVPATNSRFRDPFTSPASGHLTGWVDLAEAANGDLRDGANGVLRSLWRA